MPKLSALLEGFANASKREQTLSDWYEHNHSTSPRIIGQAVRDEWERQREQSTKYLHRILKVVGDIEIPREEDAK